MDYSLLMAIRKIGDSEELGKGVEAFKMRAKSYETYDKIKSIYEKSRTSKNSLSNIDLDEDTNPKI